MENVAIALPRETKSGIRHNFRSGITLKFAGLVIMIGLPLLAASVLVQAINILRGSAHTAGTATPAHTGFLWFSIALGLTGFAAVVVVFWIAGRRWVVHPLSRLASTAEEFARGSYAARTGLSHDETEFGRIAAALDSMAQNIAERTSQMQEYQVELEERVRQRTATLEEAVRAKSRMLAIVTHELRTPLTSVSGFAELLTLGGGNLTARQLDFVSRIRSGAAQLDRLVGDLLDISRVETGTLTVDLQPQDLNSIAREVDSVMTPIGDGMGAYSVRLDIGERDLMVDADRRRIVQVMNNLVSNAFKYSPAGQQVTVRTSARGGSARVEVEDHGFGIDRESQRKLFEPFYRVKTDQTAKISGTGLGLAICKGIIELHGGTIGVVSEPGRGSTFWFEIPALR